MFNRRSIRLRHHDYTESNTYFVTICTDKMRELFGTVIHSEMVLNDFGKIAHDEWRNTPIIRPYVILDEFIIMPNHIHGIIDIGPRKKGMAAPCPYTGPESMVAAPRTFGHPQSHSLGSIIGSIKSAISKRIRNSAYGHGGAMPVALPSSPTLPPKIWHTNYYENIVRKYGAIDRIRKYIRENPAKWERDRNNPNPHPVIS
ncbi:MAG: transposase [Patescibacteria group bacterium]